MQWREETLGGRRIAAAYFGTPEEVQDIVYIAASEGTRDTIAEAAAFFPADMPSFLCVCAQSEDWNTDLTPWEAPGLRRGDPPFGGGASAYLDWLEKDVIPRVNQEYCFEHEGSRAWIAGYSLGGLFALYAAARSDVFAGAASVSGSLWYDGFVDDLAARVDALRGKHIYLSLGLGEEKSRNPRMAAVGDATRRAEELLAQAGISHTLQWSEGGHFNGAPQRFSKGISWLLMR